MADTVISPNMNLPVAVVGVDPGPDWANNINACMSAIDSHNHTPGQGVQITPAGLNINTDLPLNGNNINTARSVKFTAQGSPLALAGDLGCVYVSGQDLYYNDEAGNQVRITSGGNVNAGAGSITGLPSGTASASFAAGTFTWQSATSTPATMNSGPLVIGAAVASSNTVTLGPSNSLAASYNLVFPAALPVSTSVVTVDSSGNMALTTGPTLTSPTLITPVFSGIPTGTVTSSSFTPTVTITRQSGGTQTNTIGTKTFYYMRIGNVVSVWGEVTNVITAWSGTPVLSTITATIPIATASLAPAGTYTNFGVLQNGASGSSPGGGYTGQLSNSSNTGVVSNNYFTNINDTQVITFIYSYLVS